MEIEIKEKIDTLEINKSCKKELRKSSITAISIIIFVNSSFLQISQISRKKKGNRRFLSYIQVGCVIDTEGISG